MLAASRGPGTIPGPASRVHPPRARDENLVATRERDWSASDLWRREPALPRALLHDEPGLHVPSHGADDALVNGGHETAHLPRGRYQPIPGGRAFVILIAVWCTAAWAVFLTQVVAGNTDGH